jgi:hypothetical protein
MSNLEGVHGAGRNNRYVLIACSLIALLVTCCMDQARAQWVEHVVVENLDYAAGLSVEDMDGDGDLDVVTSSYNEHTVQWHEAPSWRRQLIDFTMLDGYLRRPDDLDVGDINGDGLPDVVATSYALGHIVWYEAPSWTRHPIEQNHAGAQHVKVADIDGDGDLDVVATAKDRGDVRWYEAPSWTRHMIDADFDGGRGLYLADMNADGATDIVAAGMDADDIAWYEAPTWTKHIVDDNLDGAIAVAVADVDGDTHLDIVAAGYFSNLVVLYTAPSWNKQVIGSELAGARDVFVADIDNDSDLDVVATAMNAHQVVWYEAPDWTMRMIDPDLRGAYFLEVADMDTDGYLDVVAVGTESDKIVWCENTLGASVASEVPVSVSQYALHQNYPNPFRSSTTVRYDLQQPGNVTLTVFDLLGRPIESLVEAHQSAGRHSVEWHPEGLPSGVYLVQLRSSGFSSTLRMTWVD